mgnify:CR=1 FL=1
MLTDTHCHLYYDDIKTNLKEILSRAKKSGVNRFICPSTNMNDVYECLQIAKSHDQIFCSAGIHPHDADIRKKSKITGINTESREDILKLIETSKILCHNCWIKLDNDLIELL